MLAHCAANELTHGAFGCPITASYRLFSSTTITTWSGRGTAAAVGLGRATALVAARAPAPRTAIVAASVTARVVSFMEALPGAPFVDYLLHSVGATGGAGSPTRGEPQD